MSEMHAVSLGWDVGKKVDPSALCVAVHKHRLPLPTFSDLPDQQAHILTRTAVAMRDRGVLPPVGPPEVVFETRTLRRLPLGMSYPDQAAMIAYAVRDVAQRTPLVPRLYIDATGVGSGPVDILRALRPPCVIVPVYFNSGDRLIWRRDGEPPAMSNHAVRRDMRPWYLSLGKAWLVAHLQGLFESHRIALSAANVDAVAARDELLNYEVRKSDVSNDTYGAFKVGTHDDLVTALGLATLTEQQPAGERSERRGVPILPEVF